MWLSMISSFDSVDDVYVGLPCEKRLKIPKGNQNRKSKKSRKYNGQQKKVQKDKQLSTKHTYKPKDRVTWTRVLRKGRQFLLY